MKAGKINTQRFLRENVNLKKEKCVVTDLVINENANAYFSDNIKEIVFSREDLS